MSEQFIIGVTGIMGSGKTYLANKLVEHSKKVCENYNTTIRNQAEAFVPEIKQNILKTHLNNSAYAIHNIELDDVAKDILYSEEFTEKYSPLRKKVKEVFGTNQMSEMANILFSSQENIDKMRHLIYPYITSELRTRTRNLKGIILINSATLIESNMLRTVSNNLILVSTDTKFRQKNLQDKRGYSPEDTDKRLNFVYSIEEKERKHEEAVKKEGYGCLIKTNGQKASDEDYIEKIYNTLFSIFSGELTE